MKKHTLMIILLSISTILISCGSGTDTIVTNSLTVGLESAPKTLDPRYATDATGMRISHHLVFSTLVKLGYDLQIIPGLALKWETPDNKTYVFHLRKNIFFHDNKPLTGEDVKFTFEHLMDPAVQSPFSAVYNSKIERIELIDQYTVKFSLKQPTASFLTSIIMPVLPKHILTGEQDFQSMLIGSGPFKFVSQAPTEIILEKNETYFEPDTPRMGRIKFKVVKDPNTRFLKMKKGELDLLINAIPASQIKNFYKPPLNDIYQLIEEEGISYNYLGFNMDSKKVQDLRVRQAIAYGIDRDEIIDYRLYGHAGKATGLLSPVNWFYEKGVKKYSYEPEKAKQLLDAAGLNDPDNDGPEPRMVLELKTSNNNEVVNVARIIQAQLVKIGIRVEIMSYEWGTFYGDIKSGNFQITSMRWVGVTEPDFFYDIFHSSQIPPAGRNRGRYKNPEIDKLVMEGRVELDANKRKAIYSRIQKIAADDLPYISMWHRNNISIIHKRVKGYKQHPMAGFHSFKNIFIQ